MTGMRTIPRVTAVLTSVVVLTGSILMAQPASAAPEARPELRPVTGLKGQTVPASLFGMHIANLEYGAWPADLPIGSVRLWDNQTTWSRIEKSQGNFDWTNLRTAINTAKSKGVNDILMVLAGTPAWATDDSAAGGLAGVDPGGAGFPRDLSWWDNWVNAVVDNFGNDISAYQIWNEANLSTFSTASPQEMAQLTKRAYDIIKRKDPTAIVVAPSTGTRLGGPFQRFYPAYLQELGALGWPVDVWSAHTYPASLGQPDDRAALAQMWIDTLRAAGAPDLPLWDTENNFGLKGPGPQNPDVDIEGERAAAWVGRTYLDALALGMSRVYWYRFEGPNDLWGIQMYNGTPGAVAYKTLYNWIVGASFQGCTTKRGNLTTCTFSSNGQKFRIIYTENGSRARFTELRGSEVCTLNGACSPLRRSSYRTGSPVLVR